MDADMWIRRHQRSDSVRSVTSAFHLEEVPSQRLVQADGGNGPGMPDPESVAEP